MPGSTRIGPEQKHILKIDQNHSALDNICCQCHSIISIQHSKKRTQVKPVYKVTALRNNACDFWQQGIVLSTYNTEYVSLSYMFTWFAHNKIARKVKIQVRGKAKVWHWGDPLGKMKIT